MTQSKDNQHQPTPRLKNSRRDFMKKVGGTTMGAALASSGLLAMPAFGAPRTIRIGYVTPRTGPLAPFGATDLFVINELKSKVFKDGIKINGRKHPVDIIVKDSQSSVNRAAAVAASLIMDDQVDMILVSSTPTTTNPVSDQCEINGIPCIATVAPWQDWYVARGAPEGGFQYTYLFFWGLEDIINVYTGMWSSLDNNKVVGALWPNDVDGKFWSDSDSGFPPVLDKQGYKLIDPGRYQDLTKDFSAQVSDFKSGDVDILTGVPIPPDFTTFWTQAGQKGFKPKIATIGKALLFPQSVEALDERGLGLSCEYWWGPTYPYTSSLTGQSAQELADAWTASTGQQWTQPLGFAHALFEVAADVLERSQDLSSGKSIADAIATTKLETVLGPLDWTSGPVPNVAKTPLVGGQWKKGDKYPFDLKVVENGIASQIPLQAELEPLQY